VSPPYVTRVFPLFPGGSAGEGAGEEATEGLGTTAPRGIKTVSQEVITLDVVSAEIVDRFVVIHQSFYLAVGHA